MGLNTFVKKKRKLQLGGETPLQNGWDPGAPQHSSSKVDVNVKQLIGLSGSEGRFFSGPFQMAISFHKWGAITLNASNAAAEHQEKTRGMEAVSGGWEEGNGLSSSGKSDFIVLFGVNGWVRAGAQARHLHLSYGNT